MLHVQLFHGSLTTTQASFGMPSRHGRCDFSRAFPSSHPTRFRAHPPPYHLHALNERPNLTASCGEPDACAILATENPVQETPSRRPRGDAVRIQRHGRQPRGKPGDGAGITSSGRGAPDVPLHLCAPRQARVQVAVRRGGCRGARGGAHGVDGRHDRVRRRDLPPRRRRERLARGVTDAPPAPQHAQARLHQGACRHNAQGFVSPLRSNTLR